MPLRSGFLDKTRSWGSPTFFVPTQMYDTAEKIVLYLLIEPKK